MSSILESTPEAVARRLEETRSATAFVEIRADELRAGDVAGLVRRADRPVIVTVRTKQDDGSFDGSTEEKRSILEAALDAGSAFVDVEWEGPLRAFALGPPAPRTILSHHGAPCEPTTLSALYEAMASTKARRLKIVPRAARPTELSAVRDLLSRASREKRALCSFALGRAGAWSRIVALGWGSWVVYGAAARGRETGEGQFETGELLDVYRVLELGAETRYFGLCGEPLQGSPSPVLHAAGYRALGLDAVYIPVETAAFDEVVSLVSEGGLLPLRGFGITIPLKAQAAEHCARLDPFAACGAANTIRIDGGGWEGWNTDAPAAIALIREHLEPQGRDAAVVGSGATARAIGAALKEAGARVTLYARSATRCEEGARSIGVAAAPLSDLPGSAWDVLVQATPLGRVGEDVLPRRYLGGRVVLDAAYGAEETPLVRDARARGLDVIDGFDLLAAQATLQFERLTGETAPAPAMRAALASWRSASSA